MRYETLPPGVRKEKEICAAAHKWTVGIDSTFSRRKRREKIGFSIPSGNTFSKEIKQ